MNLSILHDWQANQGVRFCRILGQAKYGKLGIEKCSKLHLEGKLGTVHTWDLDVKFFYLKAPNTVM